MDAFVTRKRKSVSHASLAGVDGRDADADADIHHGADDQEPTDVKLAMLASLHPNADPGALLDVLVTVDGSVEEARRVLKNAPSPTRARKTVAVGLQTSLRSFAALKPPPSFSHGDGDHQPPPSPPRKKPRLLSTRGTTLHLYDRQGISDHTPCTIVHNFLPPYLADHLLREMLDESKTFEKATFKLFDNVVSSPHTSALFVGTYDEMERQKYDYVYNGARLTDVRRLTPYLDQVRPLVEEAVNRAVDERIRTRYPGGRKLRFQSPLPWQPTAAFVNCYDGPREHVGYHADSLTYLGPRAVIGSLSLGVSREFRVRRIVAKENKTRQDDGTEQRENAAGEGGDPAAVKGKARSSSKVPADVGGQIAIHLPHNSLLVMHAEMQEGWKHSIGAARCVDPHPIAGRRRINITYRDYSRPAFHPQRTPRCRCGVPAILRATHGSTSGSGSGGGGGGSGGSGGRRSDIDWQDEIRHDTLGGHRYFWMCHAGNVAEAAKKPCGFFKWQEFDDSGDPLSGPGNEEKDGG